MKKLLRAFRRPGFTLVELLVVIAIIGILVSIILPQINNGLFRARLTAAAANGRSIVQTIIMRDTEGMVSAVASWPKFATTMNAANHQFNTSVQFFDFMMTNEWMSVGYNFFIASGIKPAGNQTEFLNDGRAAWCIVGDINEAYVETAPALFTRNLLGQPPNRAGARFTQMNQALTADSKGYVDQLEPTANPFGNRGMVVVTKGLACPPIMRDDLKLSVFTNEYFRRTDINNNLYTNMVLRPGASL